MCDSSGSGFGNYNIYSELKFIFFVDLIFSIGSFVGVAGVKLCCMDGYMCLDCQTLIWMETSMRFPHNYEKSLVSSSNIACRINNFFLQILWLSKLIKEGNRNLIISKRRMA